MVGFSFFFSKFCDIVEVAIIHKKIKVNLAPKNEIKEMEHPSILFVTLLEVNTKSDDFCKKF
jgi:hypothetical protein